MTDLNEIDCIGHPSICELIVGQFAFMKAMSRPEDSNHEKLFNLSLDEVFKKADEFFLEHTEIEEIILINEGDVPLGDLVDQFLSNYKHIVDVIAIRQNIANIVWSLKMNELI